MDKEQMLEEAKKQAELFAEKFIMDYQDKVLDFAFAKLAELIPGAIDDAIIMAVKEPAKKLAKEEALKLAEKISDKV